ncbi:MAG TPA: NAD(P)-dependent oxidoreductase, partial [Capillimicrobium sp.]|nr:NAD(P)-dependent oxidoreductase [Capillimicrobium sp.]
QMGVDLRDLDAVVADADFLTIHLPKTPETMGLINADLLKKAKRGVRIVNAARGGIVDEAALADALASGHLAGAALDALADEPPPPGFALGRLDTVVLTPHTGAHTDRAAQAMARGALDNCLAVLRGLPAPNAVVPTATRSS